MSTNKKKAKSRGLKNISKANVDSASKKGIQILLKSFREDEGSYAYNFPCSLSKEERAYVHQIAREMGMKSLSKGKGDNRAITVTKLESLVKKEYSKQMKLLPSTVEQTTKLLTEYPLTPNELKDVLPLDESTQSVEGKNSHVDCLNSCVPDIPPPLKYNHLQEDRKKLPIWPLCSSILKLLAENQVVLISGETGSGKTTQVPQFILEHYCETKQPVRILCTQPRRIAAISVAERVAAERGEAIGGTVGYQIRLENRTSPKTQLTFCTTGILLRTLMYEDSNLEKVTHLIIDEVHERDRFCDFLLGVVRSRLSRFPHLRLILMSAALDVSVFSNYFENCPMIQVEGKCFPVTEFFLEDVLLLTSHLGDVSRLVPAANQLIQAETIKKLRKQFNLAPKGGSKHGNNGLNQDTVSILDSLIQNSFVDADPAAFDHITASIGSRLMPVDYRHSQTGLTPLMVAAGRGNRDLVTDLLRRGADRTLKAGNWTAIDLAEQMKHSEIVTILKNEEGAVKSKNAALSDFNSGIQNSDQADALLRIYQERFDEEIVNVNVIVDLLRFLEDQHMNGAVLVFLPGYEDIMTVRDRILDSVMSNRFEILMLHSSMQSADQRRVFGRPPHGKRKVVLSTNLAETSITIDDIVYVIDTGKVKVKTYDMLSGVSALKAEWVSQASSLQRKGRAGRCRTGICFHLFSRSRFSEFEKFQIPEIFRVPLEELCLQSKYLAPKGVSIAEFVGQVPEAPNALAIQRAVQMLQWMDALDPWENVTDLGRLLLELPVEPRLGKMLLTATVLRCLDPVLSVVCCLTYRDPFILPADTEEKRLSAARKLELTGGSLSDHMAMLRAFTLWTAARRQGNQRELCYEYFLSSATMEIIYQLKGQIRDQLRKSGFIRSLEELNANAGNWAAVKASIVSGLYPQVARVNSSSGKLATRRDPSVRLHMTSALLSKKVEGSGESQKKALSSLPSDWLVYQEMSRYGGISASVRCCTLVSPITLALFGGHCRLPQNSIVECPNGFTFADDDDDDDYFDDDDDDDDHFFDDSSADELDEEKIMELAEGLDEVDDLAQQFCSTKLEDENENSGCKPRKKAAKRQDLSELHIDEWIRLRMDKSSAQNLFALRQKWQALFARRMRDPTNLESAGDDEILKCLLSILELEEAASGLPTPPDFLSEANPQLQSKSRPREKSAGRYFRDGVHPKYAPALGNKPSRPYSSNGYDPAQQQAERETTGPSRGRMQNHQQWFKDFARKMYPPPGSVEVATSSTSAAGNKPVKGRANRWTKPVGSVNEASVTEPITSQRWVKSNTTAGSITSDDLHASKGKSSPGSRPSGHLTNTRRSANGAPDHDASARPSKKEAGDLPCKSPSPQQQEQQQQRNRAGRSPNHCGPTNCQVGQVKKRRSVKNTSAQPQPQHGDLLPKSRTSDGTSHPPEQASHPLPSGPPKEVPTTSDKKPAPCQSQKRRERKRRTGPEKKKNGKSADGCGPETSSSSPLAV